MKIMVLLSLFLSLNIWAKDIQFNEQDKLNVITMQGVVNVRCNDGQYPHSFIVQCYSSDLENGNYQKLQVLSEEDVDRVYLHNKKTGISKNSIINSTTHQTTREINLWIRTLTQRALVDYGVNEIEYRLTKKGQDVVSGIYQVSVEVSERRQCPNGFLYYNYQRCPDQYSICRDYFYKYRYCK